MMQGYSFLKVRGKMKSTFSGPTEMVPPPQPIGPPGGRGVYGCGVFRRRLATPRAELPCSRHIVHCFEHFQYVTQRVPFLCLKLQSCLRGSLADHLRRSRKPLGGSLTVAYAPGAPLASDIQRFGTRAGGGVHAVPWMEAPVVPTPCPTRTEVAATTTGGCSLDPGGSEPQTPTFTPRSLMLELKLTAVPSKG